jgi:response regulator RpfG family c-di-GMP phosphodiesterase
MSFEEAKKELRRYSGIRYSPEVVEKFLQMV